jgi:hypothetical protein
MAIALATGQGVAIIPVASFHTPRCGVTVKHQQVLSLEVCGLIYTGSRPWTSNIPWRGKLIALSFGVVVFSVFVQGLSMAPLLRLTGEIAN